MMAVGGKGVVSVAANIIPKDVAGMVDKFLGGDLEGARKLHYKMAPVFKAMFIETNPIPVKASLGIMGMLEAEWRLPLCPPKDETVEKLRKVLKAYGIKGLKNT
jgi:4-hydroxy-tetrahydrodipicolinate synthase